MLYHYLNHYNLFGGAFRNLIRLGACWCRRVTHVHQHHLRVMLCRWLQGAGPKHPPAADAEVCIVIAGTLVPRVGTVAAECGSFA